MALVCDIGSHFLEGSWFSLVNFTALRAKVLLYLDTANSPFVNHSRKH